MIPMRRRYRLVHAPMWLLLLLANLLTFRLAKAATFTVYPVKQTSQFCSLDPDCAKEPHLSAQIIRVDTHPDKIAVAPNNNPALFQELTKVDSCMVFASRNWSCDWK